MPSCIFGRERRAGEIVEKMREAEEELARLRQQYPESVRVFSFDADPQVMIVHCFYTQQEGSQKIAYLKQIPELAHTEAIRHDRIGFLFLFTSSI